MAKIELLNGHFNGKLGSLVGSKTIGGRYVKARVFSKAPASETQIDNLTAFRGLQRFASPIAKLCFSMPFERQAGWSFHNSVVSLFKPSIASKVFTPSALPSALATEEPFELGECEISAEDGKADVSFVFASSAIPAGERFIFAAVYNQDVKAVAKWLFAETDGEISAVWLPSALSSGFFFAFEIVPNKAEYFPNRRVVKKKPFVWRNGYAVEF